MPSLTLVAVPSSWTLRNWIPTTGTSLIGLPVLLFTNPKTKRSGPTTSSELARKGWAVSAVELGVLLAGVLALGVVASALVLVAAGVLALLSHPETTNGTSTIPIIRSRIL